MKFELQHPADQLVMIMERIYGYGMTTTSGGNLSIKDDNGDIWITPAGIDKGSLTPADIMCVKADGKIIGNHKPSSELPFHQSVYRLRPDIRAVLHAHPPALVAFSVVRKIPNTHLIPNADLICGKVGMAEYGLPGSEELGEKIGEVIKNGINTVVLENHGVVVVGEDLFKAFMAFETLDQCARVEIDALTIGTPVALSEKHLEIANKKQNACLTEFVPVSYSSEERRVRKEMCRFIHRAYDQRLCSSTQGTFSVRLDDNSFVITPYNMDRKYIEEIDLVRIENGMCEKGKNPSRSVLLHKYIYDKHPHINSIIIAHPPNIMAFAVTAEVFDSRTIPESYIMLRNIPKIPFGATFLQQQMTADMFSVKTPIIMAENDCIIVTGSSLLNAYDRLEVAEFSAQVIIQSRKLGKIVEINEEQVRDIEEAFNLER